MVDEQQAFEMIDLMLKGHGLEIFSDHFHRLTLQIEKPYRYPLRSMDPAVVAGYRQAAFLFKLLAFAADNHRVDSDNQLRRLVFRRAVEHDQALTDANLGCRQAHPRCRIHGFDHVLGQSLDELIDFGYRLRHLLQHRIGVVSNG